jgi:hypothetical protein
MVLFSKGGKMGSHNYQRSVIIAFVVLGLLFLFQSKAFCQNPSKPLPGLPLLLLSEEPAPQPAPNIVFVSSLTYNGNLGGLAGADQKCQSLATAAGLPQNTYRAWLSTSTVNAIDRLGSARGWVRVDGKPFADTKADITSGKIYHPIRVDETGVFVNDISSLLVWTGTNSIGTVSGRTCSDWTTNNNAVGGDLGSCDGVGATFTLSNWVQCNNTRRLYCFGVDKNIPVTVIPVAGRMAFVTSATWTPEAGGLTAADALCQGEATSASLPGTFKALLATSTNSSQSRFQPIAPGSLPWVRPDGVAIAPTAAELFTLTFLNTAINQPADGLSYYGYDGVWGGAWNLHTAGTSGSTCDNWTSTTGFEVLVGYAGFTYDSKVFATNYGTCNGSYHLYCLQE